MTDKPQVTILLSTYNGEKYLEEQLQSIYNQKGVDVKLLVRDDGSSDGTTEMLNAAQTAQRLSWYTGANLGPARSFWNLLEQADKSEYYAFSDQDDFWMEDKMETAISYLKQDETNRPALYFCQTRLVDSKLKPIGDVTIHPRLTLGEALLYQFIGGCTMVFNHALREILLQHTPCYLKMHDVWIYLVALAFDAKIHFDPTSHILYRQHGNNTVGQTNSFSFVWKSRWKRIKKNECIRWNMAQELWKGYHATIPEHNRWVIQNVVNYKRSIGATWNLLGSSVYACGQKSVRHTSRLCILTHTL